MVDGRVTRTTRTTRQLIRRIADDDIEFHIKNAKLDEYMPLSNFKVE